MTRGGSFPGGLATLHTLKSPFADSVASISDFCLEEEACQAKESMDDGPREVAIVCKIVNVGWRVAIIIEPFW